MQISPRKNTSPSTHKGSTPKSKLLVVERDFPVPIEKLFAAFTSADALKAWWWPEGMYADNIQIDFREGGNYFINMKGFDQGGGGMTGQFEEIEPNERIVMTDKFADENGKPISAHEANMPGEWPELIYITFDFKQLSNGSSGFTLSQQGIPNELQKDCTQGWSESFNKLEAYLRDKKH